MNDNRITLKITPDFLHLSASEAALQVSQDILQQLPPIPRVKCYLQYLREPAFIKEHIMSLLEGAPFFIGQAVMIWNYLASSLSNLQSITSPPPTRENLIRIVSVPLAQARNPGIRIDGGCYLPPSLQQVFAALGGHLDHLENDGIDDASLERARTMLAASFADPHLCASAAASYDNHAKLLHLALGHFSAGHASEGYYFAGNACRHLLESLSLEECLIACNAVLAADESNDLVNAQEILAIKARILFLGGRYEEALEIYRRLCESPEPAVRDEAMRKIVRSLERLGRYDEAISEGEAFLDQSIRAHYFRAKMERVLGWTHIQLGTPADLARAIELSERARTHFASVADNDHRYNQARALNNLGVAYEQLAEQQPESSGAHLEQATEYHRQCKQIMARLGSLRWESGSLLNLAVVERKNNALARAIAAAKESIRLKTWIGDYDDLPICQYNLALTHLRAHLAKAQGGNHLHEAITHLDRAIAYRRAQHSSKRIEALLCLRAICELLQHPDKQACALFDEVLAVQSMPENDKVPLFHKTCAAIHLRQGKSLATAWNRIADERELPAPRAILEHAL